MVSLFTGLSLLLALSLAPGVDLTSNLAAQQTPPDKPVEQTQKNIQVLKGMPSSQLLSVMHFMRSSLGVRCDYCHIAEEGKYQLDDKPAKQTARKMLQMVFELNNSSFGGRTVVTCNTCHRGSTKPVSIPAIGQGTFADTTRADQEAKPSEALPGATELFDRYTSALGGKQAVDSIRTRFTKTQLLRMKVINSGTPKAAAVNRGEELTIETYQKTPDKLLSIIATPTGTVQQGFNGSRGWVKSGNAIRELSERDVARMKRDSNFYKELNLKDRYSKSIVVRKEKLDEHEVYVVEARSLENKDERLFFDVKSGLLLRRIVFTEIKLGLDPEQTDYEDYREVDGLMMPFRVRTSYLDDNHYGTTRTLLLVKQNLEIDDGKFEPPK